MRQQCSRFIKRGYRIVESGCHQSLAAVSADGHTLVIVALNEDSTAKTHKISLTRLKHKPAKSGISAYRTTADENLCDATSSVKLDGKTLSLVMPALSITTVVINL